MKRTFSVILSFLLLLPTACPVRAEEQPSKAQRYMQLLQLMTGSGDGGFNAENNVTRAEAAKVLSDLIPDGAAYQNPLPGDIAAGAWYAPYVEKAVGSGLMENYSGALFAPYEYISCADAQSALVRILGYSDAGDAGARVRAQLTKGVSHLADSAITRGELAEMVYNALYIRPLSADIAGDTYSVSDATLLEEFLDRTEKIIMRAVLESTEDGSILSDEPAPDGTVQIGGVTYKYDGKSLLPLLGKSIDFCISAQSSDKRLYAAVVYEGDEQTFDADDVEINGQKAVCEQDGRKKNISLDADYITVYNGFRCDRDRRAHNGSVSFLDNDGDGRTDIIFISEYESFVAYETSDFLKTVRFDGGRKLAGRQSISLESLASDYKAELVTKDGSQVNFDSIKRYDAVTLFRNLAGTRVRIIHTSDFAQGKPESVDTAEGEIVIGGTTYRLGRNTDGSVIYTPDRFTEGSYILDAFGNVIGMKKDDTATRYGYVSGVYDDDTGGDGLLVRIVSGGRIERLADEQLRAAPKYSVGNSDVTLYKTAAVLRVNGRRTDNTDVRSLTAGRLVSFEVNDAGELSRMDTKDCGFALAERAFNPDILSFGGLFYIDENTQVVLVPSNSDRAPDDYFASLTLEKSVKYRILGYEIDEDTKIAEAAVISADMRADEPGIITKSTKCSVVEKVVMANVDGDDTYMLRLWTGGEVREVYSSGRDAVDDIIKTLGFGDVIYYSTNSKGLADNVQLVAELSGKKPFAKELRGSGERMFGTLYTIAKKELSRDINAEINSFGISVKGDGTDICEYTVEDTKMPQVYFVDTENRTIRTVSVEDLAAYSEYGSDAMMLLAAKKNYAVSCIVAVR